MTGQQSLHNFYSSVRFSYPTMAVRMSNDIVSVAINALTADKSDGQPAADRLRDTAIDLPEIHRRVLENALTELGYS